MTDRNIFEVKRRLRQLHSASKAQAHLAALILAEPPRSIWRAQLTALQADMTRQALKRANREDRKRA